MEKYPAKILVTFGEAVSGKKFFFKWLVENGYPELAALANAIRADKEALNWLMKYYPQYAVLSDAIDGEEKAFEWLKKYKFNLLIVLAEASRGSKKAIDWFIEKDLKIFVMVSQKIKDVIVQQRKDNHDYHKFRFR